MTTTTQRLKSNQSSSIQSDYRPTVVLCSSKDDFLLSQDVCTLCGSLGKGDEGNLIACSQCGQCYHPYCVNIKGLKVVLTKGWRCLECTVCETCGQPGDEAKLLLCDECELSCHTYCLDPPLEEVPQDAWKCQWCVMCQKCGSHKPGTNSEWQKNYTECGPCSSLSACPKCKINYNEDDLILRCNTCDRWLHASCDSINSEDQCELAMKLKYICVLCRPKDEIPLYIVQRIKETPNLDKKQEHAHDNNGHIKSPSATANNSNNDPLNQKNLPSNLSSSLSKYLQSDFPRPQSAPLSSSNENNNSIDPIKRPSSSMQICPNDNRILNDDSNSLSAEKNRTNPKEADDMHQGMHLVDGVYLSENGLNYMKSRKLEPTKRQRAKRVSKLQKLEDANADGETNRDDDEENKLNSDERLDDEAMKKKLRKLTKVGIGGFTVRQRGVRINKDDDFSYSISADATNMCATPTGNKQFAASLNGDANNVKPRRVRKKSKKKPNLIDQYPSYLQEAFFGAELLSQNDELKSNDRLTSDLHNDCSNIDLQLEDDEPCSARVNDDASQQKASVVQAKLEDGLRDQDVAAQRAAQRDADIMMDVIMSDSQGNNQTDSKDAFDPDLLSTDFNLDMVAEIDGKAVEDLLNGIGGPTPQTSTSTTAPAIPQPLAGATPPFGPMNQPNQQQVRQQLHPHPQQPSPMQPHMPTGQHLVNNNNNSQPHHQQMIVKNVGPPPPQQVMANVPASPHGQILNARPPQMHPLGANAMHPQQAPPNSAMQHPMYQHQAGPRMPNYEPHIMHGPEPQCNPADQPIIINAPGPAHSPSVILSPRAKLASPRMTIPHRPPSNADTMSRLASPNAQMQAQHHQHQHQHPGVASHASTQSPMLDNNDNSNSQYQMPPSPWTGSQSDMSRQYSSPSLSNDVGGWQTPNTSQSSDMDARNKNQNNAISQNYEQEEALGAKATKSAVLHANIEHPNLRLEFPSVEERYKQVQKLWRQLPQDKRRPYVDKARENRSACKVAGKPGSEAGGSSKKLTQQQQQQQQQAAPSPHIHLPPQQQQQQQPLQPPMKPENIVASRVPDQYQQPMQQQVPHQQQQQPMMHPPSQDVRWRQPILVDSQHQGQRFMAPNQGARMAPMVREGPMGQMHEPGMRPMNEPTHGYDHEHMSPMLAPPQQTSSPHMQYSRGPHPGQPQQQQQQQQQGPMMRPRPSHIDTRMQPADPYAMPPHTPRPPMPPMQQRSPFSPQSPYPPGVASRQAAATPPVAPKTPIDHQIVYQHSPQQNMPQPQPHARPIQANAAYAMDQQHATNAPMPHPNQQYQPRQAAYAGQQRMSAPMNQQQQQQPQYIQGPNQGAMIRPQGPHQRPQMMPQQNQYQQQQQQQPGYRQMNPVRYANQPMPQQQQQDVVPQSVMQPGGMHQQRMQNPSVGPRPQMMQQQPQQRMMSQPRPPPQQQQHIGPQVMMHHGPPQAQNQHPQQMQQQHQNGPIGHHPMPPQQQQQQQHQSQHANHHQQMQQSSTAMNPHQQSSHFSNPMARADLDEIAQLPEDEDDLKDLGADFNILEYADPEPEKGSSTSAGKNNIELDAELEDYFDDKGENLDEKRAAEHANMAGGAQQVPNQQAAAPHPNQHGGYHNQPPHHQHQNTVHHNPQNQPPHHPTQHQSHPMQQNHYAPRQMHMQNQQQQQPPMQQRDTGHPHNQQQFVNQAHPQRPQGPPMRMQHPQHPQQQQQFQQRPQVVRYQAQNISHDANNQQGMQQQQQQHMHPQQQLGPPQSMMHHHHHNPNQQRMPMANQQYQGHPSGGYTDSQGNFVPHQQQQQQHMQQSGHMHSNQYVQQPQQQQQQQMYHQPNQMQVRRQFPAQQQQQQHPQMHTQHQQPHQQQQHFEYEQQHPPQVQNNNPQGMMKMAPANHDVMMHDKTPIIGEAMSMEFTMYEQGNGANNEAVNFPQPHPQEEPQNVATSMSNAAFHDAMDEGITLGQNPVVSAASGMPAELPRTSALDDMVNQILEVPEPDLSIPSLVMQDTDFLGPEVPVNLPIVKPENQAPFSPLVSHVETTRPVLVEPVLVNPPTVVSAPMEQRPVQAMSSANAISSGSGATTTTTASSGSSSTGGGSGQPQNQLLKQLLGNCSSADSPSSFDGGAASSHEGSAKPPIQPLNSIIPKPTTSGIPNISFQIDANKPKPVPIQAPIVAQIRPAQGLLPQQQPPQQQQQPTSQAPVVQGPPQAQVRPMTSAVNNYEIKTFNVVQPPAINVNPMPVRVQPLPPTMAGPNMMVQKRGPDVALSISGMPQPASAQQQPQQIIAPQQQQQQMRHQHPNVKVLQDHKSMQSLSNAPATSPQMHFSQANMTDDMSLFDDPTGMGGKAAAAKRKNDYMAERRAALEKQPTPPPKELKPKKRVRGPNKRTRAQMEGLDGTTIAEVRSVSSDTSQQTDGNSQGVGGPVKKRMRRTMKNNKLTPELDNGAGSVSITTLAMRIRTDLPPVPIKEPEPKANNNICVPFACGDLNSRVSRLRGTFGNAQPVCVLQTCVASQKGKRRSVGFYHEEFPTDSEAPNVDEFNRRLVPNVIERDSDSPDSIISGSSDFDDDDDEEDHDDGDDDGSDCGDALDACKKTKRIYLPDIDKYAKNGTCNMVDGHASRDETKMDLNNNSNNKRPASPNIPLRAHFAKTRVPDISIDAIYSSDQVNEDKENHRMDAQEQDNVRLDLEPECSIPAAAAAANSSAADTNASSLNMRLKDHGNVSVTLTLTDKEADGVKRVLSSLSQLIDYPIQPSCVVESTSSTSAQNEALKIEPQQNSLANSIRLLSGDHNKSGAAENQLDVDGKELKFNEQNYVRTQAHDASAAATTTTAATKDKCASEPIDVKPELCCRCSAIVVDRGIRKNISDIPDSSLAAMRKSSFLSHNAKGELVFCSVQCYAANIMCVGQPGEQRAANEPSADKKFAINGPSDMPPMSPMMEDDDDDIETKQQQPNNSSQSKPNLWTPNTMYARWTPDYFSKNKSTSPSRRQSIASPETQQPTAAQPTQQQQPQVQNSSIQADSSIDSNESDSSTTCSQPNAAGDKLNSPVSAIYQPQLLVINSRPQHPRDNMRDVIAPWPQGMDLVQIRPIKPTIKVKREPAAAAAAADDHDASADMDVIDMYEDKRRCVLCQEFGDGDTDGPARLLNLSVDGWVHLNCALWSPDVYELANGALMHVELARKKAMVCASCRRPGATLKCFKNRCSNYYHFLCATKEKFCFYEDKSVYCRQHARVDSREMTSFVVKRCVYINRDEQRQIADMIQGEQQNVLRIGGLVFLNIGQLLPHQLQPFHNQHHIYPVGYKIIRFYWSFRRLNQRCKYFCSIEDHDARPQFRIVARELAHDDELFVGDSPQSAWRPIIEAIVALRKQVTDTITTYPAYIRGEDLFGLTEPSIVRILESLPGVETLTDYDFKFGRSPLLELPLAINPSGCARCEPKLRTHFKRPCTIHTASGAPSKSRAPATGALANNDTSSPYIKQFVHSKSSQYRKMKSEWRNNVVLARSRVQGLGLYAARDIEKHTMVIEYIGMLIRNEIAERHEKKHEAANRGIYMFRLDEDRVIDATLAGGLARYINHSCDPNCVAEAVEIDREKKILIIANRKILKGEELGYDYKLEKEDDQHKISCLCGAKTCKKYMN